MSDRDPHWQYMPLDVIVFKIDLFDNALRGLARELQARGVTLKEAREQCAKPESRTDHGALKPTVPLVVPQKGVYTILKGDDSG